MKSFASDNYAGIHPEVLQAISAANNQHTIAYGDDEYTAKAQDLFRQQFGEDADIFFVFNGTAANVLSLQALTDSYRAIICASTAHINLDEAGAPEKFIGSKLITVPTTDGKLTVEAVAPLLARLGDQHAVQPKVISISQTTEYGTVYTPEEVRKIADFAHKHNMYLHMDGARIANAVPSLDLPVRKITRDAGVDVLTFGGTKNGMMVGEAVIFFNAELAKNFKYIRKQGMQLASKMRFIAAQFIALLMDELWLRNARHANQMAQRLYERIKNISNLKITQPVQANVIFASLPKPAIEKLQQHYRFYVWNDAISEVRWMTAFDTMEQDIDRFAKLIEEVLRSL